MEIVWSGPEMGRKIRYYRKKRKLSQKALAKMAGVSVYRIRLMESGEIQQADAGVFMEMCQALDVEMEVMTNAEIQPESLEKRIRQKFHCNIDKSGTMVYIIFVYIHKYGKYFKDR